jgi:hypothetical protein
MRNYNNGSMTTTEILYALCFVLFLWMIVEYLSLLVEVLN